MDKSIKTTKENVQKIKEELSWHMRSIALTSENEHKRIVPKIILFRVRI